MIVKSIVFFLKKCIIGLSSLYLAFRLLRDGEAELKAELLVTQSTSILTALNRL